MLTDLCRTAEIKRSGSGVIRNNVQVNPEGSYRTKLCGLLPAYVLIHLQGVRLPMGVHSEYWLSTAAHFGGVRNGAKIEVPVVWLDGGYLSRITHSFVPGQADWTGLEPATYALTTHRSSHLNYQSRSR